MNPLQAHLGFWSNSALWGCRMMALFPCWLLAGDHQAPRGLSGPPCPWPFRLRASNSARQSSCAQSLSNFLYHLFAASCREFSAVKAPYDSIRPS